MGRAWKGSENTDSENWKSGEEITIGSWKRNGSYFAVTKQLAKLSNMW